MVKVEWLIRRLSMTAQNFWMYGPMTSLIFGWTFVLRMAPCCCCHGRADATVGMVMAETTVGVCWGDCNAVVGVVTDGDINVDAGWRGGWACPMFHCGGNVDQSSGV